MAKNRNFRKAWIFAMRFRRTTITVGLSLCLLGGYRLLFATEFGNEVAAMLGTLISSEYGAVQMKLQGYTGIQAFKRMIISDVLNGVLDLLLVLVILSYKRTRRLVEIFSNHFNKVRAELRHYWKASKKKKPNGISNVIKKIQSWISYIIKNPQNVGIIGIYVLGLLPRIPPFPGFVAIAIMIIRYNKYGFLHWCSLALGILTRHLIVIAILFGISSIF